MVDGGGTAERVTQQRWFKRRAMWTGTVQALVAVYWILDSTGVFRAIWSLLLVLSLFSIVHGWRQGVVVDERGIRTRGLIRQRFIAWDDVERFTGDDPPQVLTTDGRKIRLFDGRGDADPLHDALAEARHDLAGAGRGPQVP